MICSGSVLAACGTTNNLSGKTPPTASTPTPTQVLPPLDLQTSTPIQPLVLPIWLPPQFDPKQDTPAGTILNNRLAEFIDLHPDTQIETRIKAIEGPGGLLDSLSTASAAAPSALPDLVALPRPLLEESALQGLLHPLDVITTSLESDDWYEYAHQIALVQNTLYGIPFASDVLLGFYAAGRKESATKSFQEILNEGIKLGFAVNDPQATIPLALYQSTGAAFQDDQGRPVLDKQALSEVLTFLQQAAEKGLISSEFMQLTSDREVWPALANHQADLVLVWSSTFLSDGKQDGQPVFLPSQSGESNSLATGWIWGSPSSRPEHIPLSVSLANFLSETNFLSQWSEALGYLPARPSALAAWTNKSNLVIWDQIETAARLYPGETITDILSPALYNATLSVLRDQIPPDEAAQVAIESLIKP